MYDECLYDPATRTMDLADVGLNALHIADAEALAAIADILGERATADRLRTEGATARAVADRLLWDGERGGAAADLLRPEVLGGVRPLPSVARNDPGFAATYWRGRIWAPMAYLAVQGLRRYEADRAEPARGECAVEAVSRRMAGARPRQGELSGLRRGESDGSAEALGRTDGMGRSPRVSRFRRTGRRAAPEGWRFAHPGEPADLCDLPLGDGRLDVRATGRLTVSLDGRVLLDMVPGVVVRATG